MDGILVVGSILDVTKTNTAPYRDQKKILYTDMSRNRMESDDDAAQSSNDDQTSHSSKLKRKRERESDDERFVNEDNFDRDETLSAAIDKWNFLLERLLENRQNISENSDNWKVSE